MWPSGGSHITSTTAVVTACNVCTINFISITCFARKLTAWQVCQHLPSSPHKPHFRFPRGICDVLTSFDLARFLPPGAAGRTTWPDTEHNRYITGRLHRYNIKYWQICPGFNAGWVSASEIKVIVPVHFTTRHFIWTTQNHCQQPCRQTKFFTD